MLTSLSEQLTPAELSIKSVKIRPPFNEYSMRANCVNPRLPPSPTTLQRSCFALIRLASLVRSPTSRFVSECAFTNVPIPALHNKSTFARRISLINSLGSIADCLILNACFISLLTTIDLALRLKTPPPLDINFLS